MKRRMLIDDRNLVRRSGRLFEIARRDENNDGGGGGEADTDDDTDDEGGDDEDDDLANLLGDEDDGDEDDEDGEDDDEDDGEKKKKGQPLTADAVAKIVESAIDRRLNTPRQRRRQQSGGSGQSRTYVPSREDLRDARSGYRDTITDEVKFLGRQEREHASALAERFLSAELTDDADPYYVGERVAGKVAEEIRSLRTFYEKRTVSALRRRRVLPQKEGQPKAGGSKSGQSSMQAGASKAKQMFADRLPPQS